MGDCNMEMFKKIGESISPEELQFLSDKLSPLIIDCIVKFRDLMYTFENTFKDNKERIYFRRYMMYSILELYNGWKETGDSIPDYVKISGRNKVLLLNIEDFDTWAGLK